MAHTTNFSLTVTAGGDTTPLPTPTGLTATPVSSSQINLSWTASKDNVGVTGYKIFRGGTQVGTSPNNSYSDTGLAPGTSYTYTISAFDTAGNNSPQSGSVTATTSNSTGTLQVGPTRQYQTIGAALAAAVDGNRIEIDAGAYNEAVTVTQNNLTLKGIGGYAHLNWGTGNYLTNTTNISNGKGLMVIDGSGDTIDGLEFSGAKVVDQNGAGIRYEGGDLTIRNSYFHDNENGILGQGGRSNTLLIENSIFQKNGYCPAQCAHNVYIGSMGRLIFRFNKSIDSHEGHTLKSRASVNEVISNYLSTKNSDGSYEADFPSGGTVYFIGNVIEQGVNTGNSSILAYGEEGITNSTRVLDVVNNTFFSFPGSGTFLDISGAPSLIVKNNIFAGGGAIGPAADSTNKTLTPSSFVNSSQGDYHLVAGSAAIDGGTNPGSDGTYNLTPQYEYVEPASQTPRLVSGVIDSGAYEFHGEAGTTGPVISNVTASNITTSQATIKWATNKPADSEVEYGISTSYGNRTTLDKTLVTSHSQTISGLSEGTRYNYRVKSRDTTGVLTTSANFTFTTAAPVPFDFSLSLPGRGSVMSGRSVSFPVTVTLISGRTQSVSLSVSGVPSGTKVEFSESSCKPACTSVLTLTTSASTQPGSHTITLKGTSGALQHTASLVLDVTAPRPDPNALTSGLIGYWAFDEGAGIMTYDSSGKGNSGILINNPVWTTAGKVGGALQFNMLQNGSNDRVRQRAASILVGKLFDVPDLPLSFAAWVNPIDFNDWHAIFSKRDSYDESAMRFDVGLAIHSGRVYLTTAQDTATFDYVPPKNAWTHITIVATRANTKLYVNGKLVDEVDSVRLGSGDRANTAIGGTGEGVGGDNDPFRGTIDEVRIYNRALSATEVQQVYAYTKQ
jgi:chitodextrinase